MRAGEYIDPRRVLKSDEELETFWSHLHTMEHHYPRLNHNERAVVILNKVFGFGRRVISDKLCVSERRVTSLIRAFESYEKTVEPEEQATI
jgi:DNA-directed RNA polymerase specialized sigma24 family protein